MPNGIKHLAASSFAALLLLGACAETPEVGSDFDRSANFSGYHTFALMQRERVVMSLAPDPMHNPLVISRIEDEITRQLQGKGYALTDPAHADLVVDFTLGAAERLDVHSHPAGWGGGPPWAGPQGGSNVDVRQYREGTLAIDAFDVRSHRPVWHGWARKELTRTDLQQPAGPIHDAVQSVLTKFPPTT